MAVPSDPVKLEAKRQEFYRVRRERRAAMRKARNLFRIVYPVNWREKAMEEIEKHVKNGDYKGFFDDYSNEHWYKKSEDVKQRLEKLKKYETDEASKLAVKSKFTNYRKYLCALETNVDFNDAMLIIQDKYTNPFISNRDLARKYNRPYQKVANLLQDNPIVKMDEQERKDNILMRAYDAILTDIAEITKTNVRKYREETKRLETRELKDLSSIAKDTLERKNLMEGKPTENQNISINFN